MDQITEDLLKTAKLLASHAGNYRVPVSQSLYDRLKAAGDDMSRFVVPPKTPMTAEDIEFAEREGYNLDT